MGLGRLYFEIISELVYMNLKNEKNIEKLNKMYDNLTYFDTYGTSVILCVILTIIVFVIHSYFMILTQIQPIKDDWVNQRCKPQNMPFAGIINKPVDKTFSEYTQENFNYCIQDVLTGITGAAVQPLTYVTSGLTDVYGNISNDIQSGRTMFSEIRNKLKHITEEISGRILNITVPIQQIVIAFRDVMSKSQGALTSALYTSLGTYYTLKSLLGAIVEIVIKILILMAATIILLWIFPFTWGFAGTLTAFFIAISIPLAIVVVFMTLVLDIHSSGIPSVPSMKHCFDEETLFIMENGENKPIKDISVGEKLAKGNEINCKIIVDASYSIMYELEDIIVSDSHVLCYTGKWIPVKHHPDARRILKPIYNKPYLYCFNTSSKIIRLNGITFTDWDELYGSRLNDCIYKKEDIHKHLHCGLSKDTSITMSDGREKSLVDVNIGDLLWNNVTVVGIVEINGMTVNTLYEYDITLEDLKELKVLKDKRELEVDPDLGKMRIICSNNLYYFNDFGKILPFDTVCKKEIAKQEKLYHLLTNYSYFYIHKLKVSDYNSCIDTKI